MNGPQNAAGRVAPAAAGRKKGEPKLTSTGSSSKLPLVEIGHRVARMGRDEAILWRNKSPRSDADWPQFRGVIRLGDGHKFWAGVWMRTVKGVPVLELRLTPKQD
jgi:hypothetical protein